MKGHEYKKMHGVFCRSPLFVSILCDDTESKRYNRDLVLMALLTNTTILDFGGHGDRNSKGMKVTWSYPESQSIYRG